MDDNFNQDEFAKNLQNTESWFEAIKSTFDNTEIPPEWLAYLQKIYAYLEIGAMDNKTHQESPLSRIKIPSSGWMMHDHGDRLLVSSGDYAHGFRETDKVNDNPSPGYGTIVAQSWHSAQHLVEVAQGRWPEGANLLGATFFMQFAAGYWAWKANYKIVGLSIDKSDELAYVQIKTLLGQTSDLKSDQRPR
jgi:hypothetical protein